MTSAILKEISFFFVDRSKSIGKIEGKTKRSTNVKYIDGKKPLENFVTILASSPVAKKLNARFYAL